MRAARSYPPPGRGPFRAEQLRPGDPYELSDGHAILREPSGRRHGRTHLTGGAVIATDPGVQIAGVEIGHVLDEATLRAPDVSVGGFSEEPGFARAAPGLAIEYVEADCDETDLARKIGQLLAAGTLFAWIVRLGREPRVEVHRPGAPSGIRRAGEMLEAPGILRNAIPVEALYDRAAARDVMLRNLLQARGYADLDAVRAEAESRGRSLGALEHARSSLRRKLGRRHLAATRNHIATIEACEDLEILEAWIDAADSATSADALLTWRPHRT